MFLRQRIEGLVRKILNRKGFSLAKKSFLKAGRKDRGPRDYGALSLCLVTQQIFGKNGNLQWGMTT